MVTSHKFVDCNTIAFHWDCFFQFCIKHCYRFHRHGEPLWLLLWFVGNHHVCSCKHTTSSQSQLQVSGKHHDCLGDSRKSKNTAVAIHKLCSLEPINSQKSSRSPFEISWKCCDRFLNLQQIIMAAFASTWHCRNCICNLRNPLRSHLETHRNHCDSFLWGRGYIASAFCKVVGRRAWQLSSIFVAEADGTESWGLSHG